MRVVFDTVLAPEDLPAFRGALAHAVGLEHEWFHNHHNGAEGGTALHYRYPRIQYKLRGRQPMLICIGEGLAAARVFWEQEAWELRIRDHVRRVEVEECSVRKHRLDLGPPGALRYHYRIRNWQALNQHNYARFREIEAEGLGLSGVTGLLEPILTAQILVFARAAGWTLPGEVAVRATELYPVQPLPYKGIQPVLFGLGFRTNIRLPDGIGLGKGCSTGFGTLMRAVQNRQPDYSL
jgi:hypothetical protein